MPAPWAVWAPGRPGLCGSWAGSPGLPGSQVALISGRLCCPAGLELRTTLVLQQDASRLLAALDFLRYSLCAELQAQAVGILALLAARLPGLPDLLLEADGGGEPALRPCFRDQDIGLHAEPDAQALGMLALLAARLPWGSTRKGRALP